MITWKTFKGVDADSNVIKPYGEGVCLSTDTKPLNMANGSKLTEMNTGKNFYFDETGSVWYEQPQGGGGGGSSYTFTDIDGNGHIVVTEGGGD